jgi:UPF0755 protein
MSEQPEMFSTGRPVKRGSNRGLVALMVVAAVLVVGTAAGWWLLSRAEHPVEAGKQVEVRIPQGAGTEQIARTLSSYGIVNNSLMFGIRAKLAKSALHPGTYQFATGMPDDLVLKRLAIGPQVTYVDVMIPEGFTAAQVARRFAARAGVSEDEMMGLVNQGASRFAAGHPYLANAAGGSLEGFLCPATYRVKKGTKSSTIIEMMLDKFDESAAKIDMTYAKSKNLTLSDVVIIASILDREAKIDREYPLVASVIYNRLHAHMRLQLCSTVLYVLPEGTTKLTNHDTFNPSPYNTYRRSGLPPGPICNPGTETMRAAANPARTKYLYYVLTGKDGSQTFAKTYAEFLAAKKKYHQVFGQ